MKRISCFLVAIALMPVGMAGAQSQSQPSLGSYARAVKKQSPGKASAKVVYTNDNLPGSASLSVVGQTTNAAADPGKEKEKDKSNAAGADAQTADNAADKDKDKDALKPGQTPAEHDKALAALKAKLDEQKGKVDLLARELDVLQREYQLKATAFANNPQQRVQNSGGFDIEGAKYRQQIADKQKDVDAAKAVLTAMQDEARKSGAPASAVQ